MRSTTRTFVVLAFLALASLPTLAQAQKFDFVRRVEMGAAAMSVVPAGAWQAFTLKYSDPDGIPVEYSFEGNQRPMLSAAGMPDGTYTIEVVAHPRIPTAVLAQMRAVRSEGQGAVRRVMRQAGIPTEGLTKTIIVTVVGGQFADRDLVEEGGSRDSRGEPELEQPLGKPGGIGGSSRVIGAASSAPSWSSVAARPPSSSLTRALEVVQEVRPLTSSDDVPAFLLDADPNNPWYAASFGNTMVDGVPVTVRGYLRPIASGVPGQGQIFRGFFQEVDEFGAVGDAWHHLYFQPAGEGLRLLAEAEVQAWADRAQVPAVRFADLGAEEETSTDAPAAPIPDQVFLDDVIIDGSLCVGFDCVNGESFGFDTQRLKENNLRIHFDDTSSSASFPSTDWRIRINDTSNGGGHYFAVEDATNARTPFRIEANAPNHSLYVDDDGRIGIGTSTPVADLHNVSGNTHTLRLEQNGSSGFTPQTWDLAGNEANFFVRDATNGSTLPFRIYPGAATSSLIIAGNDFVGMGTTTPERALHIKRSDENARLIVEETNSTAANRNLLILRNNGAATIRLEKTNTADNWAIKNGGTTMDFTWVGNPSQSMRINKNGNLIIQGDLTANGSPFPDYVFDDDYDLMTLAELRAFVDAQGHLPKLPSEAEVEEAEGQVNMTRLQLLLVEKVEELTLYTLQQQELIEALQARIAALENGNGNGSN